MPNSFEIIVDSNAVAKRCFDPYSAQINRYWPFIPHRRFRFSSGRLRDLDIASNAAGDIVEIRSALVEIR